MLFMFFFLFLKNIRMLFKHIVTIVVFKIKANIIRSLYSHMTHLMMLVDLIHKVSQRDTIYLICFDLFLFI